jgi:hypothetical protein
MNSTFFARGVIFAALAITGALLIGVAHREETGAANNDPKPTALSASTVFDNLLACEIPGLQERQIGSGPHSLVYAGEFSQVTHQQLTSAKARIFLYVVSGTGTVRVGERLSRAVAGDFFVIPSGERHAVNAVNGTLRAIYFEDRG